MRSRLVNAFLVVAAVAGLAHAAPNAAITITVRVVGPPNIDSLSVSSGPGWSQIQLAGVFFGDTRGTSTVAFGAGQTESPEYLAWSDAAIACRVPEGLPLGVNYATVTVGGIISNAVAFNVTAPTELCVDAANGTGTENGTARWPFSTVGEAVQASAGGEIVRVAAGTYRETVTLANTILYLRGGYVGGADYASVAGDFGDANRSLDRVTNATAIDGERARRCILLTGCPGGELSGIIIRNGATGASGAGVSCDTSSVVIQACTIEGNAATGDGGGLYALSSTPTLSYSIIRGNTAGGVGGGVALDGGGGDLAHNAIFGNQATQGGGLCLSAAATTVRNCVVTGNESAGAGGGVAVRTSGSATLTHDTIAHNRGGGVLCQDAVTPALKHLILWGNQAAASPGIACVGGAAPTVSYSNTQGALPSAAVDAGENRSEDPLFVDPGEWVANAWDQGDYHLKSEAGHWTETGWVADPLTSPCVDVGDLGDGVGAEPAPNGACRNLGAFGSTAQASKSPPVSVHVLAADPSAAETLPGDTPNTGLFRIRRIGRIGPIAVSFLRAGTATYGATGDYTLSVGGVPLTTSAVTIPDGQDDVDILLTPLNDALIEGMETAVLILAAGTGYRLDPDPAKTTAFVAIFDNEETVGIAATDPDAGEPSNNGMFRISRSGATPGNLTVTFARQGTASVGKDYTLRANGVTLSTSVVIPAGQNSVDVEVAVINDALGEGPETVVLNLLKGTTYALDPDAAKRTATVTIADDEPVVSIAATDPSAAEPADNAMFRISRAGGGPADAIVAFRNAGTAKRGTDYTLRANGAPLAASSVPVPANPGFVDVELVVIDDLVVELTETAVLTLVKGTAYGLDADPTKRAATALIADDEPRVSIAATDPSAGEPADNGAFRITRTGGGPANLTVVLTRTGTATLGTDYTLRANGLPLTTTSVAVPANPGYADIEVAVADDALAEDTETVVLTLGKGTGYGADLDPAKRTATVSIRDNEPTVAIAALTPSVPEPSQTTAFRISRSNGGPANLTVTFTRTATAKSGTDYTLRANGTLLAVNTIVVPDSPGYVDIELVVPDDAVVEPTKTVILTLVKGTGYGVDGAARSATVSILDDEPVVSIAALDPAASEPASPGLFRITRTGGGPPNITVAFKRSGTARFGVPGTAGADYTLFVAGTPLILAAINVPANPGYVDVVLVPLDDALAEPTETAIIALATGTGYGLDPIASRRTATVTIADDETTAGGGFGDGDYKGPDDAPPAAGGIAILVLPGRGPAPLDVTAIAIGVDEGTNCDWDLDDDTRAAGLSVAHTYWSPGTYTITLRARGMTARATVVVE